MKTCEHDCCWDPTNENHSHTHDPPDCTHCNITKFGQPFVWTDASDAPSDTDVEWRDGLPYDTDGAVVARVRRTRIEEYHARR